MTYHPHPPVGAYFAAALAFVIGLLIGLHSGHHTTTKKTPAIYTVTITCPYGDQHSLVVGPAGAGRLRCNGPST